MSLGRFFGVAGLVFGLAGSALAAESAKFLSINYTVGVATNGESSLEFTSTATPVSDIQTYTIKVYKAGVKDPIYNKPASSSQKVTTSVKSSEKNALFTFQLIKGSTKVDERKISVDASVATVTPQPSGSGCQQSSSGFSNGVFCDTLFGKNVTASQYFANFYRWAVGIAILGAAVAIVVAGYRYTTSRGNPSEISTAKEIIASALVGLALLLLSYTILRFLGVNVA